MDENRLYELLDMMGSDNEEEIEKIKKDISQGNYSEAINKINNLNNNKNEEIVDNNENEEERVDNNVENNSNNENYEENDSVELTQREEAPKEEKYPKELMNYDLEEEYIGLLLNDPNAIAKYYILYENCYFADKSLLNMYKGVLFTDGQEYAPEIAKKDFNFAKESSETYMEKEQLREKYKGKGDNFEKVYVELMKLFILRKNYVGIPIAKIQKKILEIIDYKLYDKMTIEEVEAAIEQVTVTQKFKDSVLTRNLSDFLITGDNNLTNGLPLPFPILSSVFKGIRKGETMAFSMPSNSGKSRFTIDLASHIALVHKKKVLIISNEMSEEKMKLCLITTILNNPEIQKQHGIDIRKSEGELLEFKFRPDSIEGVNVDEKGFVLREENESQKAFAKRLSQISTEFNKVIEATTWLEKQIKNSIYFINITDHTNDELYKVIVNYYYKEQIEYVFYDTLKTDTENIGNGEELKKTTTILSNVAQNFNIFIGSTLQLTETSTLPINLDINDLAVSRTVKEVLDTLCLMKQIMREDYDDYEYSLKEVGEEGIPLEKFEDPDVRYYACVVDKNRAGAKPKLLFRLNLAYNVWEELGYLRLKPKK